MPKTSLPHCGSYVQSEPGEGALPRGAEQREEERARRSGCLLEAERRGVGLLQRDRSFHNYEDLESRFEKRPSMWVELKGEWGQGAVELIEIPTDAEARSAG